MATDCCKDDSCSTGTIQAPSACFDDCRLTLTKDDIKKIDTNNSGSVSVKELDAVIGENSPFDEEKQTHLSCIRDHVANSKVKVDFQGAEVDMDAALPNWFGTDFAKKQITQDEFKLIDTDGNDILDQKELGGAKDIAGLSKMSKHAAAQIGQQLDAALNDPLFELKGGVRNWHKDAKAEETAVAPKRTGIPGLALKVEPGMSVIKTDAMNRPVEVEMGNNTYKFKFDNQNRITEIREQYSAEGVNIRKISYDDAAKTQTISVVGEDGKEEVSTVNHLDDKGNIKSEEHIGEDYGDEEASVTNTSFDDKGRVKSQERNDRLGRTVSNIEYDGAEAVKSTAENFDKKGNKTSTSVYDHKTDTTTTSFYDADGRVNRILETQNPNDMSKTSIRETLPQSKTSAEMKFSNRLYLIGELVQKDGDGNVLNTATPSWNMNGYKSTVKSINVESPDGTSRVLSPSSTGEDGKLFESLKGQLERNSHIPHSGKLEEDSPGSYDRRLLNVVAC